MTRRVRVRPDRLTEPALWLDGLSYDEIAAELDTSQKTISTWISSQNANLSVLTKTPPGGVARFAGLPISLRLAF